MATRATGYTRFVRAMRVLLPLTALAILSTLFLIAEKIDTGNPFAFEDLDLTDILLQPGIVSPEFAAVTDTGEQIKLRANEIIQEPDGTVSAKSVVFEVSDPFGAQLTVSAEQGRIVADADVVEFSGTVSVSSTNGIRIVTNRLSAARDLQWFEFAEPIEAEAPFGRFSAQRARVERQMSQDGVPSYRLVFQDGVNLIYNQKN